jgi:hypothetical protein
VVGDQFLGGSEMVIVGSQYVDIITKVQTGGFAITKECEKSRCIQKELSRSNAKGLLTIGEALKNIEIDAKRID